MHPVESALRDAGRVPMRFGGVPDAARVEENLQLIRAELDAPRPPVIERLLRRLGVPDLTVPLVAATPALRRSWLFAVSVAVLFAVGSAADAGTGEAERIVVFLTLAPIIPLLGVALAFGRGVDPVHELVVAAPRDSFRVFLIRAATVLGASSLVLVIGALLLPSGGLYRIAWLLPAVGLTAITMLLARRYDPRRAAAAVAVAWLLLVFIMVRTTSAEAMFGPITQIAAIGGSAAAAGLLSTGNRDLEATR